MRRFDQLDTNRDGRLSREELRETFKVERPGDTANRTGGR
jgi:Ca2+-binding EF-hand superfamily protein